MKVVLIHGQNHKGSTYHIANILAESMMGETKEFFLPRDFGEFCLGCNTCFYQSETKCPHYEKLKPITAAMDEADIIILTSPVYVFHATGAMKAFLDHYGHRWMVHRPSEGMFHKQGVCICTAAGAGMKSTLKDMKDSMFFWGIGKYYGYGKRVAATRWEEVSPENKQKFQKDMKKLAQKLVTQKGHVTPGWKTKAMFLVMRKMQQKAFFPNDRSYWEERGWLSKKRPWL
ncbi:MAG: NAD(P)H-dependent oxidoreductase [Lachnospiraceae bacterium]|nr:NAD(P)H-dependent oxidoreductase [Lachnospiraceae bacterium]